MKKVEYSQIVRRKLKELRQNLRTEYSEEFSKTVIENIMKAMANLGDYENIGKSVYEMFGVECDYSYIFVCHNYFFYRTVDDRIFIVEMFNEKEDFMQQLFGISTISQESIDYWGES